MDVACVTFLSVTYTTLPHHVDRMPARRECKTPQCNQCLPIIPLDQSPNTTLDVSLLTIKKYKKFEPRAIRGFARCWP
jgi:hypothetical protein